MILKAERWRMRSPFYLTRFTARRARGVGGRRGVMQRAQLSGVKIDSARCAREA